MSTGQEWILPLVKWVHFFLGPWLLVCQFIDISNQMESTGEVSNVEQKNYIMVYYIKKFFWCLILRQLSPFDWKCLKIGILRAKDLRKNVLIFLGGGFTPAPLALLVIRVVLLQWLYRACNPFCPVLYIFHMPLCALCRIIFESNKQ